MLIAMKKKGWLKISKVIFLALLILLSTRFESRAAEVRNMLANGSLEIDNDHNGIADRWDPSGNCLGKISSEHRQGSGSQFLQMSGRGASFKQLKRVHPGTTYTLGFWAKVIKGELAVNLFEVGEKWKPLGVKLRRIIKPSAWSYHRIVYHPGKKVFYVQIRFGPNQGEPTEVYLDGAIFTPGEWKAGELQGKGNPYEDVFLPRKATLSAFRTEVPLGGIWDFQVDKRKAFFRFPPLENNWIKKNVPHNPGSYKDTNLWYRRMVKIPSSMEGKVIKLRFLGAAHEIKVYCNGKLAGGSFDYLNPFEIDITKEVKFGVPNEIIIGAFKERPETVGPPGRYNIYPYQYWMRSVSGLYGPVSLVSYPKVYVSDVFVITSTRNKDISLQITLRNEDNKTHRVSCENSITDWNKTGITNPPVLEFKDKPVITIPPNSSKEIVIKQAWSKAQLWWPDSPHLYLLSTRLKERNRTIDNKFTRFGFREIWIAGTKLMLNGVRVNLRGVWGGMLLNKETIDAFKKDNILVARAPVLPNLFWREADVADEEGFLITPMAGLTFHDSASKEKIFWKNITTYFKDFVKAYRNHPSIIMWDTSVEWVQSSGGGEQELMRLEELSRKIDPTRPVYHSGSGALNGRSETISLHYPHEYSKAVGGVGSFTTFPNTVYWLEGAKTVRSAYNPYSEKLGKKPLLITESGMPYMYMGGPDGLSFAWGDEAYKPHTRQELWDYHLKYLGMLIDGERYSNVACILVVSPWNFNSGLFWEDWREINSKVLARAYQPLMIHVKEMDRNFFANRDISRTLTVYNDVFEKVSNLKVSWEIINKKEKVFSRGEEAFVLAGGVHKNISISFRTPPVNRKEELFLKLDLYKDDKLVFQKKYRYTVYPAEKTGVSQGDKKIALFDEQGLTKSLLDQLGLKYKRIDKLSKVNNSLYDLLIIGKDSLSGGMGKYKKQLETFVRNGGNILSFEQNLYLYPKWLPIKLRLDTRETTKAATITFPRAPGHPLLKGITKEDLRYWRPDAYVTRHNFIKPYQGNFRIIIDSGNMSAGGLNRTSLIEIPYGKGKYILNQTLVTEKYNKDPIANLLCRNLLEYALTAAVPPQRTALFSSRNSSFKGLLAKIGLKAKELTGLSSLDTFKILILALDKKDEEAVSVLEANKGRIRDFVKNGGKVFILFSGPFYKRTLESLLDRPIILQDPKTHYWFKVSADPLLWGLSNDDFYWKKLGPTLIDELVSPSPPRIPKEANIAKNSFALLDPAGLVKIPEGKGFWLLCQLNLLDALKSTNKPYRILSGLLTNLGVQLQSRLKKEVSGPRNFFYVDISKQANMGFKDEVADDRKGGWTDQGANDLRNIPTGVHYFTDIPFKVIKPESNHGKSCIVLYGTPRTYFPKEVKGIPVEASPKRLYFLQALGWDAIPGQTVAIYQINYSDGTTREVPVKLGIDVRGWWGLPRELINAVVGWQGANTMYPSVTNVIYIMKWENPIASVPPITSIDFISTGSSGVPILIAITGEK